MQGVCTAQKSELKAEFNDVRGQLSAVARVIPAPTPPDFWTDARTRIEYRSLQLDHTPPTSANINTTPTTHNRPRVRL